MMLLLLNPSIHWSIHDQQQSIQAGVQHRLMNISSNANKRKLLHNLHWFWSPLKRGGRLCFSFRRGSWRCSSKGRCAVTVVATEDTGHYFSEKHSHRTKRCVRLTDGTWGVPIKASFATDVLTYFNNIITQLSCNFVRNEGTLERPTRWVHLLLLIDWRWRVGSEKRATDLTSHDSRHESICNGRESPYLCGNAIKNKLVTIS